MCSLRGKINLDLDFVSVNCDAVLSNSCLSNEAVCPSKYFSAAFLASAGFSGLVTGEENRDEGDGSSATFDLDAEL